MTTTVSEDDQFLEPTGPPQRTNVDRLPRAEEIESGKAQTPERVALHVGDTQPRKPVEGWMLRWTYAAELLHEVGKVAVLPGSDPLVQRFGAKRGFLVPYEMACSAELRGEYIRDVVTRVVAARAQAAQELLEQSVLDGRPYDHALVCDVGWGFVLTSEVAGYNPQKLGVPLGKLLGLRPDQQGREQVGRILRASMWRWGLFAPTQVAVGALPAIRALLDALIVELESVRAYRDPEAYGETFTERERKLRRLIAPKLFETSLSRGEAWSDDRLLPVQCRMVDADGLFDLVNRPGVTKLVTGPAGCGKSMLGRLAAAAVLHRTGLNVVVAVPTRALVTQSAREYRKWLSAGGYTGPVLAASRDYHRNDLALSRGAFDVAVTVYEKLAAFMGLGSGVLEDCGLLIIDEAHNVAEAERGPKLESFLSAVKLRHPGLAIMLISAGVDRTDSEGLVAWLDMDVDLDMVSADEESADGTSRQVRPTDLEVHVADGRRERWWLDPTSKNADLPATFTDQAGPALKAGAYGEQPAATYLPGSGRRRSGRARPQSSSTERNYRYTGELVRKMLTDDPERLILIFVRSRNEATSLAVHLRPEVGKVIARSGKRALPGLAAADLTNPWITGRFAWCDTTSEDALETARERFTEFSSTPTWEGYNQVLAGLRTGVGVHRAGLTHVLRTFVEEEFRGDGLLRVLVSTDSLAEGMNLPADIVIVCHLTQAVGPRAYRVIDVPNFKNKIGRAGRLGVGRSPVGQAWVLPDDLNETLLAGDVSAVKDIDGVWRNFVEPPARGVQVRSAMDELDLSTVVLTRLLGTSPRHGFGEQELEDNVAETVDATLWRHSAVEAEVTEMKIEVVKTLRTKGLLDADRRLTKLGRAVARSSIGVRSAAQLARLANVADGEAHPLELLYEAALLPAVGEQLDWIAMPDRAQADAEVVDDVELKLRLWAVEHLAPGSADPYVARLTALPAAPHAIVGLRRHEDQPWNGDHTALLRAVAALRWSVGEPFAAFLKARSSRLPPLEERGRQPVRIELGDLEHLTSLIAWGLRAAVQAAGRDGRMALVELSRAVAVGLPSWMAPLARLELPGLHREILTAFTDLNLENVMDIFDDATFRETVDPQVCRDARRALERQRIERFNLSRVMSRRKAAGTPDEATHYGDWIEEIEDALETQPTAVGEILRDALRTHGVETEFVAGDHGTLVGRLSHDLAVVVSTSELTAAIARDLLGDPSAIVLVLGEMTDGAEEISEAGRIYMLGSMMERLHDVWEASMAAETDDFLERLSESLHDAVDPVAA